MNDKSRYSIKDDRWHILNKTPIYLGPTEKSIQKEFFIIDNSFKELEIEYSPALFKMINEIIDNSVDVLIDKKSKGKIELEIKENKIIIKDNGDGIPIKKIKDLDDSEILIPIACFGRAKAGSNFNNDAIDEKTIGTNGVGSFCCNVLSKLFHVETINDKKKFNGVWRNNSSEFEYVLSGTKDKSGTKVTFIPDLERFGYDNIDQSLKDIIKQRLINLSLVHKNISFFFNGEIVDKDIKSLNLGNDSILFNNENYDIIIISPNNENEFKSFTIMNGLTMKGGSHIDFVLKNVCVSIKDKLPKKYDDIKFGDIKNRLSIYFFGKNFKNMKFESQTKEYLKNSQKEVSEYLGSLDNLISNILRNKDLLKHITEFYDIKKDYEEKRLLKSLVKPKKKIRIEKYKPAIKENKYFVVAEGLSALSSIISATGRDQIGSYPLKGKVLNCLKADISKLRKNNEIKDILEIMNLKILSEEKSYTYENLLIATDADLDGENIKMLLLTLFVKYKPDFIKEGRVKFLKTPIVVAYKGNKPQDFIFELSDLLKHQENKKGYDYKYKKGLASMDIKEYEIMFKNGIEEYIETLEYSDDMNEVFYNWMGDESQKRKDMLKGSSFDLFLV